MTALYTVMATGGGLKNYLPLIIAGVIGVLLLVAFCIGLVKGVRRVSWTGCVWLLSGVAFFLLESKLGEKVNGLLAPKLAAFSTDGIANSLCSFLLMLACALVVMLVFGLLSLIFRPKIKWVKKRSDRYTLDEDGVDYDEEYEDYDDYEEYESRKEAVKKGYGTPSVVGRIFGGLSCMLNIALVLSTALCLVLLIANATALKDGAFSSVFAYEVGGFAVTEWLLGYAQKYAWDMLLIGILVAFTFKGNKSGFLATLRVLLVNIGSIVAVALSFYLPFSKFTDTYYLGKLVGRCENMFSALFGEKLAMVAPIVGKLFVGLLLAVAVILIMLLLNWLLKKAVEGVQNVKVLRVIDGSISGVLYLTFGVLVCALVWALLYTLGYYNVLNLHEIFMQNGSVSNGLLEVSKEYVTPILDKIGEAIKGFGA